MIPTADLLDLDPDGLGSCELQLRQYGGLATFEGRIRTVRCRDDTVLVKRLLAVEGYGQVLVIDGGASTRCALMGDNTARMARDNGWVGIVVNGLVRDVTALADLDIGIKALGSNPRKPGQEGAGNIDVPVSFGAVTFRPGDYLWSDPDGVVTGKLPGDPGGGRA